MKLIETLTNKFVFVDIDDEDVINGAWELVEGAEINVLRDKELMGAIALEESPWADGSLAVVGAWFGSSEGMDKFSFDLIVDPHYQNEGVGKMLFSSAMQEAADYEVTELEVVNPFLHNILRRNGFAHEHGRVWTRRNY